MYKNNENFIKNNSKNFDKKCNKFKFIGNLIDFDNKIKQEKKNFHVGDIKQVGEVGLDCHEGLDCDVGGVGDVSDVGDVCLVGDIGEVVKVGDVDDVSEVGDIVDKSKKRKFGEDSINKNLTFKEFKNIYIK